MRRRGALGGALGALLALAVTVAARPALAGSVLDRVRASGSVGCSAEERPGFAARGEDGVIVGLAVDLCRAVGVAVLGPQAQITFSMLDSTPTFDVLRAEMQDVVFLTAGTIAAEHLAGHLLVGPPAFIETESLMVPDSSTVRGPRDLAGKGVCFMIGTGAQRALEAALERDGVEVLRLGFEEDVEMRDAYNVGRCQAVAAEATFLAAMRRDGGIHALKSRILDAPLALDPVYLATGIADARWSAIVTWTLQSLVLGAAPRSDWTGAGTTPLAEAATPLGFRDGWSRDVTDTVGTYADLWRKDLGADSPLRLAPGLNAPWPAGLLLPPASP